MPASSTTVAMLYRCKLGTSKHLFKKAETLTLCYLHLVFTTVDPPPSPRHLYVAKNMELALEWLESNRAVMDEEHVNMGWFLRFQNGSVYDNKREPPSGTPYTVCPLFLNFLF